VTRAFVWSRAGGEVLLDPLAGFAASAGYVLNAAGFVAGTSFSPALTVATVLSPAGTPMRVPEPAPTSICVPVAIDAAGVVVGEAYLSASLRPWIWDAANGTRDLVALGSWQTSASPARSR
jgi:hypothetical protein